MSPALPVSEKAAEKFLLVRLERSPIGLRFLQMEDVFLGVGEAEKVVFLLLLDDEIAADGEVDDGGGDVPHVDGIVDQRADFAGSEFVGRFVLRSNGAKARIAAARPPQPEHQGEGDEGKNERPVAAKIKEEYARGSGLADGAFVERDGDGEAFVHGQGAGGADVDASAGDFGGGIAAVGAVTRR